jgi:hypothetical protein
LTNGSREKVDPLSPANCFKSRKYEVNNNKFRVNTGRKVPTRGHGSAAEPVGPVRSSTNPLREAGSSGGRKTSTARPRAAAAAAWCPADAPTRRSITTTTVGPRGRKPCSSRLSRGSPPRSAAAQDAEVVAGDVDQISFVVRRFACLPTPGRRRCGFPLNEVSKPVYVIDREGLCSRRGPSRPLTKSGAAIHCEASVEGDDGAAQSRIWADDGSGRFSGARRVRCRPGRRLAFRGLLSLPGSRRGATPTPTRPPHTPAARRSR